ncbi:sensor histidine kinase [Microbacterium sp. RG1]|uniref:sensor histidine kinase n=1 Tax=Microbacterium sp. RG1 TaxID=2489212 RepID=UPI0010CA4EEF|nr:histidine kinase [Microbacterium sp. RG1]QCQ16135.1 ATP-binding protein [Microbacterium sp. RG1]
MSKRGRAVAGAESTPPDDGLLLPRPPGAIRRYWSRHPRFADALVAFFAFVLSGPGLVAAAPMDPAWAPFGMIVSITVPASTAIALLWRRRFPLTVFLVAALPYLFAPYPMLPSGVALAIAVYSLSVYRSSRAAWAGAGILSGAIVISGLVRVTFGESWSSAMGAAGATMVMLLIGALIGANVGGRKRYVEALIERSRQLTIERDQQAQLATAAERTRIAREMHDIVSHSLTVIVALSEGAAATTDTERARSAARTAADTARGALTEMRAMLGVLRTDDAGTAPLAPLTAPSPREVVATAQGAGYPVVLRTSGRTSTHAPTTELAIGRVVQEGMTNAMRHAPRATEAVVEIREDPDAVRIRIMNDGVAGERDEETAGFGLRGLTERVAHAGGTLRTRRGDGTWTLDVWLPTEENTR